MLCEFSANPNLLQGEINANRIKVGKNPEKNQNKTNLRQAKGKVRAVKRERVQSIDCCCCQNVRRAVDKTSCTPRIFVIGCNRWWPNSPEENPHSDQNWPRPLTPTYGGQFEVCRRKERHHQQQQCQLFREISRTPHRFQGVLGGVEGVCVCRPRARDRRAESPRARCHREENRSSAGLGERLILQQSVSPEQCRGEEVLLRGVTAGVSSSP